MRWSRFFILTILMVMFYSCGGSSKEDVYPFSKVEKIEVISYTSGRESWEEGYDDYISNGKIAFSESKIRERVWLNEDQADDLYEFLFEDECPFYGSITKCYDPRHMVLFYDKDGKIFDYFEACLECGGSKAGFKHNEVCMQRTGDLHKIFADAGIKYFGD